MSLLRAVTGRPGLGDLPVLAALPELAARLAAGPELAVLQAPPGSGKTILAPLWLVEKVGFRRVWVLVPRRVNARLPVLFLESSCGQSVGYRIRFESRWNEEKIKVGYLTYGTALRSFADAPPGSEDLVIFDEFHERPWEADLLLAHLRGLARQAEGPRLLLMSATLDEEALPPGTAVVRSDGRLHPVEITREKLDPQLLARPDGLASLVSQRSAELAGTGGEQLIFLPGISSIRTVEAALRADRLGGPIDVLHSSLPESEIRRVVERPAAQGFRRILSTDLAESSVTLPGVTSVIDAGLQRRPRRDAFGLGITLETVRAPLSSLAQRAGRAGRLQAGRCHRLLSHQDELHRDPFGRPEIGEIDGKTLALHLAALGRLAGWQTLEWLSRPDSSLLEEAAEWLLRSQLVQGGILNYRGRQVLRSACSPRAGLFGLLACEAGWPPASVVDWVYAAEAGAGREAGEAKAVTDLLRDRTWTNARDQRLLQRLRETFTTATGPRERCSRGEGLAAGRAADPGEPLLKAFADTLVEIRGDRALPREASAEALLFRSAHPGESRYAVVLATAPAGREGPSSMVTLYQSVSSESLWQELLEELQEDQRLEWDAKSRSVKAVRRTTLGALIIDEEVVAAPAGAAVADLLYQNLSAADFGEDFAALCRRLERFLEARPELAEQLSERVIPVGQQGLLPRLILGYLQSLTRWGKGAPEGLLEHVQSHLGYQTLKALESALPTSVKLPGRQRPVAVHYPEQGSPFVASKLQDFFGWKPPLLLDGRLRLACHLLAPSGRPVQITEDLEGFWKGSYQQVRKDLRGRYPKHAWPENP